MDLMYRGLLHISLVVSFLIFLGGALECFFGYKIYRIQIALIGFAVGFMAGGTVSALFVEESIVVMIAAVILGLLCALLAYKMYLVGAFITAFFMGTLLFGMAAMMALENVTQSVALGALAGVLVGIVAVRLVKPIIVITTAATGACAMSTQLVYMIDSIKGNGHPLFNGEYLMLAICFAVFFLVGMVFQFATTRNKKKPVEPTLAEEPAPTLEPTPVVEAPTPAEEPAPVVEEPTPVVEVEEPTPVVEEPSSEEEPVH